MDTASRLLGGTALRIRQRSSELVERAAQVVAKTDVGKRIGRRHEQRSNLLVAELRQRSSIAVRENDTAARAPFGVHGNAGGAQRVEIAIDRFFGDFERFGDLARRRAASGLEHEQHGQQAFGLHRPDSLVPGRGILSFGPGIARP